ncbi:MAG: hypothetical protein PSV36_06300 [Algoriphagus sp.]|nr:hypothetical protein [Algoriphagus sp.]
MKKFTFILLTTIFFSGTSAFAQQDNKLTYFVGVGPAIDGNIGLWGLNFSNELSFKFGKRGSINPSLTFYQSIGSFDNFEDSRLNEDNSSGIFTNATLGYNLLKTKNDFKISVAIGPSFQLGSENALGSIYYDENDVPDYRYRIEKFNRLGITQQITFDWASKNENRVNSAMISMTSFEGYWPWYLMATYRIGFKLK